METLDEYINTGSTVVTKENMDDEDIKGLWIHIEKEIDLLLKIGERCHLSPIKRACVMVQDEIVKMEGISKEFPGVKALSGVNLTLKRQSPRHCGENGAGKSTLIKILMGAYQKMKAKYT